MTLRHFVSATADGKILQIAALDDIEPTQGHGQEITPEDNAALFQNLSGYYIVGATLHLKGVAPSANHVFDYSTKQWIDPRTLDDLKVSKWSEMKVARANAIAQPLETSFGIFDADPVASENIIKSVLLANNLTALNMPASINFTLANNTVVALSGSDIVQVGLALAGREQTVRAKASAIRVRIEAATSKAALNAILW